MSIHKHTVKRMDSDLNKMIKSLETINNSIDHFGYESLENRDRKYYAKTSSKIRKLNHKINRLINDHYMT